MTLPRHDARTRSVLLVIADDAIRDAFSMLLRSHGYQVRGERVAEGAIVALREGQPRLIVFDQSRPGSDGGAFAKRLQSEPAEARVPLLLLGGSLPEQVDEGIVAGVFPTPVELDRVLDMVRRFCDRRVRDAGRAHHAPGGRTALS